MSYMGMGMGIITEFTEMSWNDCVFEHTKEHLRVFWEVHCFFCLCIKKIIFSIMKRFFTTLRFVQNDRVLFFTYD